MTILQIAISRITAMQASAHIREYQYILALVAKRKAVR